MPADPDTMIEALEGALTATPAGVTSVTIDGQTTTWNRRHVIDELGYWRRRKAEADARAPGGNALASRFSAFDMSGGA